MPEGGFFYYLGDSLTAMRGGGVVGSGAESGAPHAIAAAAAHTPVAEVRKDVATPLTGGDMQRLLPGARILTYPTLGHFRSIEDVLRDPRVRTRPNPAHAFIVLFVTDKSFEGGTEFLDGHWCAVFYNGAGELEYFDPYGEPVDSPLRELSPEDRAKLGETRFYLRDLLADYAKRGGPITVNRIAFQKDRRDVATCGRHCAFRVRNRHLTDEEYARKISEAPGVPPDVYVTLATEAALGHAR